MPLYTALGDSITSGQSATNRSLAYPSLLVAKLKQMRNTQGASGEILAQPGWTSASLYQAVIGNPTFYLSNASAITIWIGGDDLGITAFVARGSLSEKKIENAVIQYGKQLSKIIGYIRSVSRATIIVCTQYNPFPNSPIAAIGTDILNATTVSVSMQNQAQVAPIHTLFQGRQSELIAGYQSGSIKDAATSRNLPIHPNNFGHQVIANALLPLIALSMQNPNHL